MVSSLPMRDIKEQLEYVRDVRKKRLAVVISPLGQPEKVLKTFHLTQIKEAEHYAQRCAKFYPTRITDTKNMEVIRIYLKEEAPRPRLEDIMNKFRKGQYGHG